MKYRIIIERIEEKPVTRSRWVQVDPYVDNKGETHNFDYRDETEPEEVTETVYTQRSQGEIGLKAIIDAFNAPPKP